MVFLVSLTMYVSTRNVLLVLESELNSSIDLIHRHVIKPPVNAVHSKTESLPVNPVLADARVFLDVKQNWQNETQAGLRGSTPSNRTKLSCLESTMT